MGKLYVMRHAATYYLEAGRYAGNLDIPLSKNGIEKSIQRGEAFNYQNFDVVFTSGLSRSFDTAMIFLSQINTNKVPIRVSFDEYRTMTRNDVLPIVQVDALNERNYGVLQDMSKKEIEESIPNNILKSWRRDYYKGPDQGETFQQVVSRTAQFYYNVLLPILKEKDVLIVAHQNTIRALYFLVYNVRKKDIDEIEFSSLDIWSEDYNAIFDPTKVNPKDAIILAAGMGTRMGSLTETTPKPLLRVNGKPLLDYAVNFLRSNGFSIRVVYSPKKHWGAYIRENPDILFVPSVKNISYHENLLAACEYELHSNYTFILSADLVFNSSVFNLALKEHIIHQNEITVVLNKKYGKHKKWQYIFKSHCVVEDIIMQETIQPYERYFLIVNNEVLIDYIQRIKDSENFYDKNEKYGTGANFFVKNMIDMGMKVNYLLFEDYLVNVNYPVDLKMAERILNDEYM